MDSDQKPPRKKPGPPKGVRYGGRKKGTPNKRSQEMLDMILATGCKHPVEGMAILAKRADEAGDTQFAGSMYKELAQYVAPKRRAVEVTGQDGGPVEHNLDPSGLSTEALRTIVQSRSDG